MKRHIVFIVLFITILTVLIAGIPLRGVKTVSYVENRDLKTFPQITLGGILDTSFQQDLEQALSDQLIFGENFKSAYNSIKSMSMKSVSAFYALKHDATNQTKSDATGSLITDGTDEELILKTSEADPDWAPEELVPEKVMEVNDQKIYLYDAAKYNTSNDEDGSYTIIPRGGNILEIDTSQHLLYIPATVEKYLPLIEKKAACYNKLVEDFPQLSYSMLYIETDMDTDFINHAFSHDINNTYVSLLNPQIKNDRITIQSVSDYQKNFFKTDHHWNAKGQYEGYKKAIRLLKGENEKLLDISVVQIEGLKTNGSKARIINDFTISDDFTFLWADLPPYDTYINGDTGVYGKKSEYLSGDYPKEKGFNHYGNCNGWDYGIVEYDFKQPEKENLLMFIDSFGNSVLELIAAHFNKTYVVDLRYYSKENDAPFNFKDFIADKDIKEALFFGPYYFHTNELHSVINSASP